MCGHSYGGIVISGVTEKAAKNIRSIVFLDAFVPENGQCHMDLFPLEYAQLMRQDAQEWAKTMLVKHPLACFEQKLTLTGSCQRVARRTYILATGWPSPFAKLDLGRQARRLRDTPSCQTDLLRARGCAGTAYAPRGLIWLRRGVRCREGSSCNGAIVRAIEVKVATDVEFRDVEGTNCRRSPC
jgi:pimeloyl-ACP methyl ester carboxylesterase